jgi:hypothetical protein
MLRLLNYLSGAAEDRVCWGVELQAQFDPEDDS